MLCYFLKKSEAHLGIQYNNHFNPFHIFCFSGEAKEWEIEEAFLSAFQLCENKGQVTYAEFEDYYEGVSLGFESDQEFTAMMRNCWSI